MTGDSEVRPTGEVRAADAGYRPRDTRYTTILLVARLIHGDREDLCRIRNVSAGGMLVESYAGLSEGDALRVELRNLQSADAIVAWTRGDRAGCRFVEPIDVQSFLAPPAKAEGQDRVPRSPRVAASCPVEIRRAGKTLHALLLDISQSGCRLGQIGELTVDDRIYVNIPGMEPRRAVVRWVGEDSTGVGFVDTVPFPELCAWLHDDTLRFAGAAEADA